MPTAERPASDEPPSDSWRCEECGAPWAPLPDRPDQCRRCGNRTRIPAIEPPFISPFEIIKGYVRAAGGGVVVIVVDRDTEQYPSIGAEVAMVCERKADG